MSPQFTSFIDRYAIRDCIGRRVRSEGRAVSISSVPAGRARNISIAAHITGDFEAWFAPRADVIKNTQHLIGQPFIEPARAHASVESNRVDIVPLEAVGARGHDGGTVADRAKEHLKSVLGPASKLNSGVGWSPEFPGRVIAAQTMAYALENRLCGTLINAELAAEYGLTANDGCVIPRFGLFAQHTIESRELRQGEAEE